MNMKKISTVLMVFLALGALASAALNGRDKDSRASCQWQGKEYLDGMIIQIGNAQYMCNRGSWERLGPPR